MKLFGGNGVRKLNEDEKGRSFASLLEEFQERPMETDNARNSKLRASICPFVPRQALVWGLGYEHPSSFQQDNWQTALAGKLLVNGRVFARGGFN